VAPCIGSLHHEGTKDRKKKRKDFLSADYADFMSFMLTGQLDQAAPESGVLKRPA